MTESLIRIRGAREHNLRDLDLDLPRNRLIVVTGLSGSGKSSLAFDTIYAEGQRRYVESLSAYARQFLGQMDKPDVDSIEGLSPAISIEQKGATRNPRSTVGTITEIHDYLRLLYARTGTPHCPQCGRPIVAQTIDQMAETVLALGEGTKVQILAPLVRGRKGEHEAVFRAARKDGFVRVRVDGEVHEVERAPRLDKKKKHDVEVVVDRIVVKASARSRLADSLTTASRVGQGTVVLDVAGGRGDVVLSESFACPDCGVSLGELTPRSFSFNSPYGACPACNGLGSRLSVDPELVVPDPHLSIVGGAIAPWRDAKSGWYRTMLKSVATHAGFDLTTPWGELPAKARKLILWGTSEELEFRWEGKRTTGTYKAPFDGVIPSLERRHRQTESEGSRLQIERFMRRVKCTDCDGTRLRPESRAVRVGGLGIAELSEKQIDDARAFLAGLKLDARRREIAGPVLKEIRARLDFLTNVGVGYLSLDRAGNTLSGGEAQRIRLATQLGSSLVGVLYILDEPSIGLHARDHRRLLDSLVRLRDLGNTVIVVEHDRDTMLAADHLLDLGPGAGRHGGAIVAEGTPKQVMRNAASLTGKYLSGRRTIEMPERRRPASGMLRVLGAAEHNLQDLDVDFPLGCLVCVTGVSGSGKSTLVNQILARACAAALHGARTAPGRHRGLHGLEALDKAIVIDQSPIGRTPRSNPATYTGVFTEIRSLFAETKDAKVRGYKPGRFSFNVRGGRCEACEGDGLVRIEMHFLPDVFVKCDECGGARYNRETLGILYKGANIAEVLEMTVDEGLEFLANIPSIRRKLQVLSDVGLGYVHLGQSATTLSGGEAQRVKLATELARVATGRTLYVLDEPTTGLHFEDIRNLLRVLQLLVDRGNTVVVIEHNLDVIKCADHVIDLGPEGGHGGGRIVALGTPEMVAATPGSHTGAALGGVLVPSGGGPSGTPARRGRRRTAEPEAASGR